MKFSDELSKLWEDSDRQVVDPSCPSFKDPYWEGYLDGIERSENHVRRLEKSYEGSLATLRYSFIQLLLKIFHKGGNR